MKIGSIEVGVNNKKSHFDFTHDVNTTSDFGFCQPTLVQDVIPDSTISLDTKSVIRLGNLPTSPFARMMMKQYNCFVPLKDVHMAYKEMFSQTDAYSPVIGNYKPSNIDYVSNIKLLWDSLVSTNMYLTRNDTFENFERFVAIPVLWRLDPDGTSAPVPVGFRDSIQYRVYETLMLWIGDNYPELHSAIFKYEPTDPSRKSSFAKLLTFGESLVRYGSLSPTVDDYKYFSNFARYLKPNISNADYLVRNIVDEQNVEYILTFHLTHFGRRLFKVYQSAQIEFGYENNVSVPVLLSYYKAWFDIFNPGRVETWKNTLAYKLIHNFFDYNIPVDNFIFTQVDSRNRQVGIYFDEFLLELPLCCYCETSDSLTVSLPSPVLQNVTVSNDIPVDDSNVAGLFIHKDSSPTTDNEFYGFAARALLKLVPYVNKSSVIGKQVDSFLNKFFNISLPERLVFGTSNTPIVVDDIYATAETDHNYLGELGGKCLASQKQFASKIHVKEHGYIIQLSVIIPLGGYSQSFGNQHSINFNEFYQSVYDGMGHEGVGMSKIFGERFVFDNINYPSLDDQTFGFRPMMMGHKYRTNVRGGDFKNRSTRNNLMTYCLDRYFDVDDVTVRYSSIGGQDFYDVVTEKGFRQTVNEELRFIGRSEHFGNYDRIFIDQFGNTDNFLLHMVQNLHITAPMLPVSESFDTFDKEVNDGSSAVKHQ